MTQEEAIRRRQQNEKMTNEEAVYWLTLHRDNTDWGLIDKTVLNMSIEALSRQTEDAVSRQAVIDLIADFELSMGQVVKGVYALPPVNPEPKTGHWIYYRNEKGDYINQCSVCGQDCGVGYPYNFCPNCGAKNESMVERKDNTDNQYNREKCYDCCNKDKSVLDMPCCKCSAENDYVYFNAHEWEYESINGDDEE